MCVHMSQIIALFLLDAQFICKQLMHYVNQYRNNAHLMAQGVLILLHLVINIQQQ